MAETDLHPDIVKAIRRVSHSRLGKRFDRMSRAKYGIPGWKLAAKQTAGEFGGRSTETGRAVVSSAGARGPAQFIPSTREAFIQRYGVDPWKNDVQAIKGLMLHDLSTGVAGYNPGMPSYTNYILGQHLNAADRRALRSGKTGGSAGVGTRDQGGTLRLPGRTQTQVTAPRYTIPGQSFEAERDAARRELLLGGDLTLKRLLEYKTTVNSLQDVPSRTVSGDLQVTRTQGPGVTTTTRGDRRRGGGAGPHRDDGPGPNKLDGPAGGKRHAGGIYEVFYDPLGRYWDAGGVRAGAIGDHSDHVHVSADRGYVVKLGRYAQRLGLTVLEQSAFTGSVPTSGHKPGSFHYRDMAIDVSGNPAAMRKFARVAMKLAEAGRGK